MKKLLLLLVVAALLPMYAMYSQSLSDVTKQIKGDTLVIKTFDEMGNAPNSLYVALFADTNSVPAGRVYELQTNGWYPNANGPNSSGKRKTVIYGETAKPQVTNTDPNAAPPMVTGYSDGTSSNPNGIAGNGDLTIKNCQLIMADNSKAFNWCYTGIGGDKPTVIFDNCLFERTRWVFAGIFTDNVKLTFRNCYFVNMNGQACRRNGGVLDGFNTADTLLVENCTHISAQGSMYKLRNYPYKRVIINHNTFVNCSGYQFLNLGYQSNMSLTNNIFVNCNIQPYPKMKSIDDGEQDLDWLPMGLVNVYPDSADVAQNTQRKFLVQANLAYWDPYLSDIVSTVNAANLNGVSTWQSQAIVANSRTDSMFKHIGRFTGSVYSYLVTDTWKNKLPAFTNSANLFTTSKGGSLYELKKFTIATVDTGAAGSAAVLPDWRILDTASTLWLYPDWPIPVNLAYSDADLKTAGIGGFPLGDLNWFPTQKANWLAQRNAELANIQNSLDNAHLVSTGVGELTGVPSTFALQQNYPNPFNPSTLISFTIPKSGNVSLKVYDVLGQEVATLMNEFKPVQSYEVKFDARGLASGIYFYTLQTENQSLTKKMVLMK
jgi:hypothetical protein